MSTKSKKTVKKSAKRVVSDETRMIRERRRADKAAAAKKGEVPPPLEVSARVETITRNAAYDKKHAAADAFAAREDLSHDERRAARRAAIAAKAPPIAIAVSKSVAGPSTAQVPEKVRKVAAPKEKKERAPRGDSVTKTAEEAIKSGRTDEEVLALLAKKHGVDPVAKKSYPMWYRARLVRKGEISKKFADDHRHAEG